MSTALLKPVRLAHAAPPRTGVRWPLAALMIVCCLLAAAYSVAVPPFEAPDEPGHYEYVEWLASGRGLPLQGSEPPPLQPEYSQPPLYYLLQAPIAWLAGLTPANLPRWETQRNPFQNETDYGNVNLYLHLPAEHWPWSGEVLGLHLMRLANVVLVALLVLATYGCGRELRVSPPVALCAAALVGLTPQVAFLGGALNADNAVGSLSAVSLYLLLRWLNRGPSAGLALLLGLALGAAALSKLSGLVAVVVALGVMAVRLLSRWRRPRVHAGLSTGPILHPNGPATMAGASEPATLADTDVDPNRPSSPNGAGAGAVLRPATAIWRPARDAAITAGAAALIAGWWYVRNWLFLGDPLGWQAMLPATGAMLRQPPLPFWPALGKLLLRWYTGLASFGWTNLTVHWVWYWLFAILGLWGAVGLLLAGGRAVLTRRMRLVHWLLLVWPLAFVVSLARWVEVNTAADQWRLLFPAYPALALLLTIGLWHLLRRSWQPVLALAAGLLALNVGALMLSILPAYAGPSSYSGRIAHPLDIRFGSSLRLVGYSTPRPVGARPESPVEIDLFWQALGPIRRDYAVDAATVDATGRLTWKELSMPDQGRSPMTAWTPGRVMLDRHVIRARPEMVGVQTLLLSVLDPAPPGLHLQAVDGAGRRLANDGASLARFMVLPSRVPEPLTKDAITFQDHLALTGHSVEQIGDQLRVTLDWKATGSIGKDYTVFVHLLAPNGRQVAQHDGQPSGGAFPTSLLPVNAAVPDVHVLDIPSLPPGDYRLEIGLYDLATGARLVTDRGGSSVTLPAHLAKLPPVPLG